MKFKPLYLVSVIVFNVISKFAGPNRHQLPAEDAALPADLPYKPLLLYHPKVGC